MESAKLPKKVLLIFFKGMFDFARHEKIRILLEDAQTGAGAEIDLLATIHSAGTIRGVCKLDFAGSFVFEQWGGGSFSQSSVVLMV